MKTRAAWVAFALLGVLAGEASGTRHQRSWPATAPVQKAAASRAPERAAEPREQNRGLIEGRVRLVAGPRQAVDADESTQTVVYFLPAAGAPRPSPKQFTAVTYTKGFEPDLLVVPVGSTVQFANRDVILHNVFSATPGSTFSLGSYGPGETRSHTFDRAGLVVVNCSVHRSMRANVLVLETPYSTRPSADGRFRLSGLPEAAGTLVIWHPRAVAQAIAWDGHSPLTVDRTLVATRARLGMTGM